MIDAVEDTVDSGTHLVKRVAEVASSVEVLWQRILCWPWDLIVPGLVVFIGLMAWIYSCFCAEEPSEAEEGASQASSEADPDENEIRQKQIQAEMTEQKELIKALLATQSSKRQEESAAQDRKMS